MLVHDIRGGLHLLLGTGRENQGPSAPQSFDVSLSLGFSRPDPGKFPNQVDLEIEAWKAHDPGDLEARRLCQGANLFPRKTKGLDLADDVVHAAGILK
jgi:hypothetical protein